MIDNDVNRAIRPHRSAVSRYVCRRVARLIAVLAAAPAVAGPPCLAGDPEPTELARWEVYGFATATHSYQIAGRRGARSYAIKAVALSRAIGDRLSIGVEAYHHARDADAGSTYAGANLGVTYRIHDRRSLLGAGGPGPTHGDERGRWNSHIALKTDD